uniref:SOS response-associated peptidase n=1 Tax=Parabacteroides distasonis TaxID=823 RepID=UPI003FEFFB09
TGYFEWRHEDGKKIPYYIYVKDEPIFSMAGIYDSWLDKVTGEIIYTFSIITTEANSLTDYIHNTKHRMPAILSREDEERWLDPKLEKSDIEQLLLPFSADQMDAYVIDNDFLKKPSNDPTILDKVS